MTFVELRKSWLPIPPGLGLRLTAATAAAFADCVTGLARDFYLRNRLAADARHSALAFGKDTGFESIYFGFEAIGPAPIAAKL